MSFIRRFCLILALVSLSTAANAQTMFKCTQANGKIAFQAEPCPDTSNEQVLKASKRGEVKVVQPKAQSEDDINANATPPVGARSSDTAPSNIVSHAAQPAQDVNANVATNAPVEAPKAPRGIFETIVMVIAMLSFFASILAHFWLLIVIFGESLIGGLLCLFIPGGYLVFVAIHWEKAKVPFMICVATLVAPLFWLLIFDRASGHHSTASIEKPRTYVAVEFLPTTSATLA